MNEDNYYILSEGQAIKCITGKKYYDHWLSLQNPDKRTKTGVRVAFTNVDNAVVSTVFLGRAAYGYHNDLPILWETAILIPGDPPELWRYSSHKEALEGHEAAVEVFLVEWMDAELETVEDTE